MIFFARYEAGQFDAAAIETEHLLLGLLREEPVLAGMALMDAVRARVESAAVRRAKTAVSQDMPLSHESKRVLAYGAEESERLRHRYITGLHLALGLQREQNTFAARLMAEVGLTRERLLEAFRGGGEEVPAGPPAGEVAQPLAELMLKVQTRLRVAGADGEVYTPDAHRVVGHLIDLAIAHHAHWVCGSSRPLLPSPLNTATQRYGEMDATRLVHLWLELQQLLLHLLSQPLPEDETDKRRGEAARYVEIVAEWVARWLPEGA